MSGAKRFLPRRRPASAFRVLATLGGLLGALSAAADPPRTVLSAQLGMVPWKGIGHVQGLAARGAFEKYLAAHPGVDVVEYERIWLPGLHWGAAQVMSVASTAGPDLMFLTLDEMGAYVREGLVQPLDDLMDDWVERSRWPAPLSEGLRVEGRHWGMPNHADWALIAGWPPAFSAIGLDERAMPDSLAGLAALAGRLTVPGTRKGLGIPSGRYLAGLWLALAREGGADPVTLTSGGIAAELRSDASRRAAQILAEFGAALRSASPDALQFYDDPILLRRDFSTGKLGMVLTGMWDMDDRLGGDLAAQQTASPLQLVRPHLGPIPGTSAGAVLGVVQRAIVCVIPSWQRDVVRRDLSFAFYSEASDCGSGIENEWLAQPPRPGLWVPTKYLLTSPAHPSMSALPSHWSRVIRRVADASRPVPPDPEWEALAAILGGRLAEVLRGGLTPAQALEQAETQFEETAHLKTRRESGVWTAVAWGVLAAFAAAMGYGLWRLVAVLREEIATLRMAPADAMTGRWAIALTLFLPAIVLAAVFGVIPLFLGLKMSLYDHVLRDGGTFIGARHYLDVIVHPRTARVAMNTAFYLALSFVLGFIAPLVLAVVLSSLRVGAWIVRTAFFLPAVASAVVVAILWQQMFEIGGPFNAFVGLLGFGERRWLAEPSTAMLGVVLASAWSTLGVSGLTYLAGLSAIPDSLYEEAELSGAGLMERLQHVTWPHLQPLILINLVGWLITSVRTAEQVFLLTGGGPAEATYIVGLDIFNQAYVSIRFGYAMAEVWLLVALILILSIYQMRAVRTGQVRVARI